MSTVGTIELIAKIDTSQYKRGVAEIERDNQKLENSSNKTSSKMSSGFSTVAKVGMAAIATAAIAVGAIIVKNFDNAIKRVDTLNNSARTFQNMGFAADVVKKSMTELEKSIIGLPTSLDEAIRGTTSLAATYGDVQKGQKVFTSLNNAILGFGGTADMVNNAILQLSQMPMDGPLDAQTWNSLRNSGLTPVLVAMAKDMGMGVNEMKKKFGEGELKVKDFTDALVNMNEKGGGGMKSLEKIAKDSTSGIATGWANFNTAVTRGIASIIEAIGSENISAFISNMGAGLEQLLKWLAPIAKISLAGLVAGFTAMGNVFNWFKQNVLPTFKAVWDFLKPIRDFVGNEFKKVWEDLKVSFEEVRKALAPYAPELKQIAIVITAVLLAPLAALVAGIIAITLVVAKLISWLAKLISWWTQVGQSVAKFKANFVSNIQSAMTAGWNTITKIFGRLVGWFSSMWNKVVSLFKTVGSRIGNAIGNAFKGVINSVLRRAVNIINGFINAINSVIGVINKIPGAKIGKLRTLGVPALATGGIVTAPTLAMVGEGREPEAVIPLSKLDDMLNGNVTNNKSVHIENVYIASDYDADKLLNTLGIKQDLYNKGVVSG